MNAMQRKQIRDHFRMKAMWHTQHIRKDKVIWEEHDSNLIVDQGLGYILGSALDGSVAKIANFYVGVYKANRTPLSTDTGTSYPTDATEATEYDEAARPGYVGVLDAGPPVLLNNTASRAEFTFNASITIYGGFLISLSTKGVGGGTLINAKEFNSPRNPIATDVLRIAIEFSLVGA
jgi:hypothetical protein